MAFTLLQNVRIPLKVNVSEFQNKTNCNSVNIVVYDGGKVSYYGNGKEIRM